MKALRDWNHNGKDDLFDRVTDRYIYEKVFKEDKKGEPESRPKSNTNYTSTKNKILTLRRTAKVGRKIIHILPQQ